jgi:hypothetical protein
VVIEVIWVVGHYRNKSHDIWVVGHHRNDLKGAANRTSESKASLYQQYVYPQVPSLKSSFHSMYKGPNNSW